MADDRPTAISAMIDDLHRRHLIGVDGVCEVWLVRHADAYTGLVALEPGLVDPPLSPSGRAQAALLAERLAGVPLDRVWASDLRRARDTAAAVAEAHGLEVRTDPRLREARTYWDEGASPGLEAPGVYPFPEPEVEVAARMAGVLEDIAGDLGSSASALPRAVVVTHNAAIVIYLSSLLGLRWGSLRLLPQFTSVSVLAIKGGQVVIRSVADATHLVARRPR